LLEQSDQRKLLYWLTKKDFCKQDWNDSWISS
jgi:hypothetical protein